VPRIIRSGNHEIIRGVRGLGEAGGFVKDDIEVLEDGMRVDEVEWATRRLFHNQPSALQMVKEWVLGVSEDKDSLYGLHGDTFRTLCEQARKGVKRDE